MLAQDALPLEPADPKTTVEMPQMMLTLGLEPQLLREDHPALYAGMERACAGCGSKAQCRTDLDTGAAEAAFRHYCGNATTLDLLRERGDLQRS